MTEEKYRYHDTVVKWLSLVLAVIGAFVAYKTYVTQQDESRSQDDARHQATLTQNSQFEQNRNEQYARRFWEKQLDLYFAACKAAATLATVESPKHAIYAPARAQFDQLYFGELCIVESEEVAQRMVDFKNAIETYEKDPSAPGRRNSVRDLSLQLAFACRASTEKRWQVELGPITAKLNTPEFRHRRVEGHFGDPAPSPKLAPSPP
jgi:hypothetical protein